ncbi:MAG TPA: hypothetical protein VF383_07175 [Candidatus Dormibacteraeota bacterium]
MPRRQWALAAFAVLLAVAIVATLVGVRGALHSMAPTPAKHGPRITLHHNGQIVMGVDNKLVAIDPTTGELHTILSAPADARVADPAYSQDGTELAYFMGPAVTGGYGGTGGAGWASSIWVLDTATGHTAQLISCPYECDEFSGLSWSPDGSRLVFSVADYASNTAQLDLVDSSGAHLTQLTHLSSIRYAWQPSWSPDGTLIAFATRSSGGIGFIKPDGSGLVVRSIGAGNLAAWDPTWSPDGSRIAYVHDPVGAGGYELWSMDPDGSHRTQIFTTSSCCMTFLGGPAWSPDGTLIATVTFNTLWVMNADGSNVKSLGAISNDRPAWQPVA